MAKWSIGCGENGDILRQLLGFTCLGVTDSSNETKCPQCRCYQVHPTTILKNHFFLLLLLLQVSEGEMSILVHTCSFVVTCAFLLVAPCLVVKCEFMGVTEMAGGRVSMWQPEFCLVTELSCCWATTMWWNLLLSFKPTLSAAVSGFTSVA